MYFKSLELFGFKSFAERTRLDFEPGITAIVGPNGCGKSNIADAIKWVLGEQSAKELRGGKMEDVIFNGTDGKEPVSYAEVSLVLSNQDRALPIEYDEVTITRRLYRSGESEYLLNKTPVRLKDITELFMGTGIGTSAYSHMEQGKIDQVLSSRPEERREIFEEASGITKYKSKKKEALRRLEDTEQNLLRINDIIAEVKRQINSIERQAKKAERYQKCYDELKEQELKLSRIELERLTLKLAEYNKNFEDLKLKEERLANELESSSRELSLLSSKRSEVETKRMELKSRIIEADSEVTRSRDKINLNRDRIEELKKRCSDLELEIENVRNNIVNQAKEINNLKEKVSILEKENLDRSNLLSTKDNRLKELAQLISENETILSTSKANIMDIASRQAKLKNQQARLSSTITANEARLKRLQTEQASVLEEKNGLDAKLSETLKELESIEKEVSSIKGEKIQLEQSKSELEGLIIRLREESNGLRNSIVANKSRLEMLQEARLKYEGFSSGVKAILAREGQSNVASIEGVRDVLANLVDVTKGYELAIESALGEYLQAIVVDNINAAEKALSFLKSNSLGKASFICLDLFKNLPTSKTMDFTFDSEVIKDSRILGPASKFVSITNELERFVRHILEGIYVVNTVDDAVALLKENKLPNGCSLVTLSGDVIKGGIICGGASGEKDMALINRNAKIKELSDIINGLEVRLAAVEKDIKNYEKENFGLEEKIRSISSGLNEKEILLSNMRQKYSTAKDSMKEILDELSLVNLEIEETIAEIKKFKDEENAITNTLSQLEKDAKLNEERLSSSERLLGEYASEKERLLVEIAEMRTEIGSLESKKEGLSNTLNLLENSLKDAETTLSSRQDELKNSTARIQELSEEILVLEDKVKNLTEDAEKARQDFSEIDKLYTQMMDNISLEEESLTKKEKEMEEIRAGLHDVDLKKAEVNYNIESIMQRIKDVYKINLSEVLLPESWQDIDIEALKLDVEDKRSKLDAMGPVNLAAIQEQTDLQDRYTFLINQRDDLLKAKESLLKAIAKINKTTKELFIETFQKIQVEFRNFFKMLFGGGDGQLILIDEGNVLESGIEIVAKPPGKRLQNVSLLSGGEKALTAIALLFAIFKVKPSPFCVLDEIDAPLDEANVDRFSRMLDLFTNTSQFIVITHNKKTIDKSDVMYGITMQESGVSKVVSVKFSDAKKQELAKEASPE